MKTTWFKRTGWLYIPISLQGVLVTLLLLAVFIHDLLFVNSRSHSISDLYYNFIPYGFIYIASWMWIASKTSQPAAKDM